MLDRIDEWLLDKVFQRLADRVADRCSNFVLSQFCAEMVVLSLLGGFVLTVTSSTSSPFLTVFSTVVTALVLLFAAAFRLAMQHADSRIRCGTANPLRIQFQQVRHLLILLTGLLTVFMVLRWQAGTLEVSNVFTVFELLGWVGGYYFGSCNKLPPPERHKVETRVYA